jgi:hypothetical protein
MRIGLDVAQTCFERHGCGWVADRIATAIGDVCSSGEVFLYRQFGDWLNWDTSKGTARSDDQTFPRHSWIFVGGGQDRLETDRGGSVQLAG